jgi:hypothetical protein
MLMVNVYYATDACSDYKNRGQTSKQMPTQNNMKREKERANSHLWVKNDDVWSRRATAPVDIDLIPNRHKLTGKYTRRASEFSTRMDDILDIIRISRHLVVEEPQSAIVLVAEVARRPASRIGNGGHERSVEVELHCPIGRVGGIVKGECERAEFPCVSRGDVKRD